MSTSYVKINGVSFEANARIMEYKRNFNVLNGPNAGRVLSGDMILDPIGTYLGRNVTFSRKGNNYAAFDALWDYLVEHSVDAQGVLLECADGQSTLSMRCYYSSGEQPLEKVENGINYWGEFSINFIPMKAQVRP